MHHVTASQLFGETSFEPAVVENFAFTGSNNNKKAQLTQREARDSLGI